MDNISSQRLQILQHLQEHGSITSMEAIQLFGCTRLSGRIFDLRRAGYDIAVVMTEGRTRSGSSCRYATYIYKGGNHERIESTGVTETAKGAVRQ